ncbi:MAG: hypothetical protein IPM23_20455 [Candidatus Melainabacteria bacterium]|nr:hypothetical protein [Candidatus Melainabacteria bacterium]
MENLPDKTPEKQENTAVGIAKVLGLICVSPLLIIFGSVTLIALAGILFGTMHEVAPWIILAICVSSLMPAIRDRISGKKELQAMQIQLEALRAELAETRLQMLELEEGHRFDRTLETSATESSPALEMKSES